MIDPVQYWTGGWRLMQDKADGLSYFDFGPGALKKSFISVLFGLPVAAIAAFAAARQAQIEDVDILALPLLGLAFLIGSLTFAPLAYLIAYLFKVPQTARKWIIMRHWMWLLVLCITAMPFTLNLAGILPYEAAVFVGAVLFIGLIWMDYAMARHALQVNWIGALLSACIVSCGFLWAALMSGLALSYLG